MKHVLVIGVFNVLHPGHIRMLRFARECGDHLTVAVQSNKTSLRGVEEMEKVVGTIAVAPAPAMEMGTFPGAANPRGGHAKSVTGT